MVKYNNLDLWVREYISSGKKTFAEYYEKIFETRQQEFLLFLKINGEKYEFGNLRNIIKLVSGQYIFTNINKKALIFNEIDHRVGFYNRPLKDSFANLIKEAKYDDIIYSWYRLTHTQKNFVGISYFMIEPSKRQYNSFLHVAIKTMTFEILEVLLLNLDKTIDKKYFNELIILKNYENKTILDLAYEKKDKRKIDLIKEIIKKNNRDEFVKKIHIPVIYDNASIGESVINLIKDFNHMYNFKHIAKIDKAKRRVTYEDYEKISNQTNKILNDKINYLKNLALTDESLVSYAQIALNKSLLDKIWDDGDNNKLIRLVRNHIETTTSFIQNLLLKDEFFYFNSSDKLDCGLKIKDLFAIIINYILDQPDKNRKLEFNFIKKIEELISESKSKNYPAIYYINHLILILYGNNEIVKLVILNKEFLSKKIELICINEIEKVKHKLDNKDIFLWVNNNKMHASFKNHLLELIGENVKLIVFEKYSKYYKTVLLEDLINESFDYVAPNLQMKKIAESLDISQLSLSEMTTIIKNDILPYFIKTNKNSFYPFMQNLYDKNITKFVKLVKQFNIDGELNKLFSHNDKLIFFLESQAKKYVISIICSDMLVQSSHNLQYSTLDNLLLLAAQIGLKDEIFYFISKGGNLGVKDDLGITLLHWCVTHELITVINYLKKYELNPNESSKDGTTPLMLSAKIGNYEISEMLLRMGADPNKSNAKGMSALIIAAHNKHKSLTKLFLKRSNKSVQDKSQHGGLATYMLISSVFSENDDNPEQ